MNNLAPKSDHTSDHRAADKPLLLPPRAPIYSELNSADASDSVSQLFKVLVRHRWKLAALIFIAMAGAVVLQLVAPKVYEASTLIKVDRHVTGGVVGQEATQVTSVDDMDQIMATQMELAKSDPVLRPVVEKFPVLEAEGQLKGLTPAQAEVRRAAPITLKNLKIDRLPTTYLLRITYRAHDRKLAADVANAVAQSLIAHANDTGNRSSAQISASVATHLTELRGRIATADQQLADFEKELNMDPEQRVTVQAARLTQLNTEYTAAQTERVRRESVLGELSRGSSVSLASAQTAQAASQDSTVLNDMLQKLNAARQQFALVKSYYGEGHPEYVKAQHQVKEIESELEELQSRSKERATDEYRQALAREQRLQGLVQETKRDVDSLKSRAHQYEQLRNEADGYRKIYQELSERADIADINRQFQNATVQVVAQATTPLDPIFPKLKINLAVAVLLAGILGVFAALIASAMKTTCSDPEDFVSRHHVNVLSSIPVARSLPRLAGPDATPARENQITQRYREGIRYLRSALTLIMVDKSIHNVLVTSAVSGEGKSTTSVHLAVACAQLGKQVLLVDADFRHPTLHKQFSLSNSAGLSDALLGRPTSSSIIQLEQPGLFLMPVGSMPRKAGDRISTGFSDVLTELSHHFDLVIVDGSPMLGVAESQEIAGAVDSVLLVTKAEATTGKMVSQTLELLSRTRANLLGVVMNQVKTRRSEQYGYYGYSDDEIATRLGE